MELCECSCVLWVFLLTFNGNQKGKRHPQVKAPKWRAGEKNHPLWDKTKIISFIDRTRCITKELYGCPIQSAIRCMHDNIRWISGFGWYIFHRGEDSLNLRIMKLIIVNDSTHCQIHFVVFVYLWETVEHNG